VTDFLLALIGALAGLLYLAREQGRVMGVQRGFQEQLRHQRSLLGRRAAVVTEYLQWAQRSGARPAAELDRLSSHQVQGEHAAMNLGRNPGDRQALEAFKASGIQMVGSRQVLGDESGTTGARARGARGPLLLQELKQLDESLTLQTKTTCALAELLEQTRRRPVARISSLVAHFGILPGPAWGFRS
jgi:septal ring factor EnvC (AmiA/AmiB activator)